MFNKQYQISGSHGTKLEKLVKKGFFENFLSLMTIAPLYALNFNKTSPVNKDGSNPKSIFLEQILPYKDEIIFVYRITLFVHYSNTRQEDKLKKIFSDDLSNEELEENMQIYHSYLLGGIDLLFEKYDAIANNIDTKKYRSDNKNIGLVSDSMNILLNEINDKFADSNIDLDNLRNVVF